MDCPAAHSGHATLPQTRPRTPLHVGCRRKLGRQRRHSGERCRAAAAVLDAPVVKAQSQRASNTGDASNKDLYKHFEQLLTKSVVRPRQGDKVMGTLLNVDQRGAYIDIGAKIEAFMPRDEASMVPINDFTEVIQPNSRREFLVLRDDHAHNKTGEVILSLKRLQEQLAWQRLHQMHEEDVTLVAHCVSVNRGGLMVRVEGIDGFCPASHLPSTDDLAAYINQELKVKFLELDAEASRAVYSMRRAAQSRQITSLTIGQVVEGVVQSVKPYGAFIDVGNRVSGLLHISEISHDRVTNVADVLGEGDKIKVMVITQDKERGRFALSTKKLEPTPGDMLRDPNLVFQQADEMAEQFRKRMEQAEAASRQQYDSMAATAGYVR